MKELSLRPYIGRLFLAFDKSDYERSHKRIFKTQDVLTCHQEGRFTGGEGQDGVFTYLIWATDTPWLAHEISHCILHVFEQTGIDPRDAGGEPFCYMLSQLLLDAGPLEATG